MATQGWPFNCTTCKIQKSICVPRGLTDKNDAHRDKSATASFMDMIVSPRFNSMLTGWLEASTTGDRFRRGMKAAISTASLGRYLGKASPEAFASRIQRCNKLSLMSYWRATNAIETPGRRHSRTILAFKSGEYSLRRGRDGSGRFPSIVSMCPFAFRGHEVTIWDAQFQYDFIGRLPLSVLNERTLYILYRMKSKGNRVLELKVPKVEFF